MFVLVHYVRVPRYFLQNEKKYNLERSCCIVRYWFLWGFFSLKTRRFKKKNGAFFCPIEEKQCVLYYTEWVRGSERYFICHERKLTKFSNVFSLTCFHYFVCLSASLQAKKKRSINSSYCALKRSVFSLPPPSEKRTYFPTFS